MITYTWELTSLKRKNSSDMNNIIIQTYWKKIGTDENGNTAHFAGATPFDISTVDPDNFVPYEDLTEEIILGWIQSAVGYEDHINERIEKQLEEIVLPITSVEASEFPWSQNNN